MLGCKCGWLYGCMVFWNLVKNFFDSEGMLVVFWMWWCEDVFL